MNPPSAPRTLVAGGARPVGFNYRMDAFQGAVLSIKLKHLERWTESRRLLAERYRKLLAGLPIQLPAEAPQVSGARLLLLGQQSPG